MSAYLLPGAAIHWVAKDWLAKSWAAKTGDSVNDMV